MSSSKPTKFIGDYSSKRVGEPMAKARISLEVTEKHSSVIWLYDKTWYHEINYTEIELYLLTKANSIPGELYLITIEELGLASGLFSVELLHEVIDHAFAKARGLMLQELQLEAE